MIEDGVPGGGLNPGAGSSNPGAFTDVDGTLLFTADDGTNGRELWKSDGIAATMIEDAVPGGGINPGGGSSFPFHFTEVNGTVFFRADDGTDGDELWKATIEGPGATAPQPNPPTMTAPPLIGAPTGTCEGRPATIVGTAGRDRLKGTPGPDVILGLGGRDTIKGLAGEDSICGARGRDRLRGGGGKDRLLGQGGRDALNGQGGRDFCRGGPASDRASSCERERSI